MCEGVCECVCGGCVVPCHGLAFYLGFIPATHLTFLGYASL